MRYPTMTAGEANMYLSSKRAGNAVDPDVSVKLKGSGPEMDPSSIATLREALGNLRKTWPEGLKNFKDGNSFEGKASRLVHSILPEDPALLGDPDFWIWLAVVCFPDIVEWRYGSQAEGTKLANYGVGARTENLLYRLWLRAELVLDEGHKDRYHLADAGQVDFYRSHLFRQGYANARTFARALLRFQYPHSDPAAPNLKVFQIRDLVKRLRRMRSNLFLEILPEDECRAVIEAEAAVVLAN